MSAIDCISHAGIVKEINNNELLISILNQSACASCHAKGVCTSLENSEKIITVTKFDITLRPGDQVIVKMHKSIGFKAVFMGYGLPFIVLIVTLLFLKKIFNNEIIEAVGALISVVIYFLILKLFNRKVQSAFIFEAERA